MAANNKPLFHSPKKTGEVIKIPTSLPMKILSIVSLVLLVAMTGFAIYACATGGNEQLALYADFTIRSGLLFLFFPFIGWVIALGFRMALRLIPLEMWRLPAGLKQATIKTKGKYLKLATLLLELEAVLGFGYITISLYLRKTPADAPMLIFLAAVVITVFFCGRYTYTAAEKVK